MGLFGIIFYIIIIVIFINAKKMAQSGSDYKRNSSPQGKYSGQKQISNVPKKEEQIQPKIRTNNLWGEDEHAHQRIVALRLMEGDPVPEGYEKIKCPYCGADNLVTKHCKQYHSCYFCRVPID